MPINNLLKSVVVIAIGSIVGYSSVKYFMPEPKNRSLASFPASKLGREHNAKFLFDARVNADDLAKTEDGISTIRIKIEAFKNLNSGLIYSWNLPSDVELVEGVLSDDLGALSQSQSKEISIKVRGFSKQFKKFLSFEVKGEFEQRPVNREILVSSRVEDSFEYVVQQNEKVRKSQAHKMGIEKQKNKFSPEHVVR